MLTPTAFTLDAFEKKLFHGFTNGQLRNGFACPLFTLQEGLRLAAFNNATDFCGHLEYNPKKNAFLFVEKTSDAADPTVFSAVEVDGQTLYPIGAAGWSWSQKDSAEVAFSADLMRELAAMKEIGMSVPDKAFDLVSDIDWVEEQINMRVSDAADLAIDLAGLAERTPYSFSKTRRATRPLRSTQP